jgi:hypothetical protein
MKRIRAKPQRTSPLITLIALIDAGLNQYQTFRVTSMIRVTQNVPSTSALAPSRNL